MLNPCDHAPEPGGPGGGQEPYDPRCPPAAGGTAPGALLRHQPRPVLRRDRLAFRPPGQPVLAGPAPVRVHSAPAGPGRAGPAARLRPGHHQPGAPGYRAGLRAHRRRTEGRRRAAGRSRRAPPPPHPGHRRRHRLPDRVRPPPRGHRPAAAFAGRPAGVGSAQPERPQRSYIGTFAGTGVAEVA